MTEHTTLALMVNGCEGVAFQEDVRRRAVMYGEQAEQAYKGGADLEEMVTELITKLAGAEVMLELYAAAYDSMKRTRVDAHEWNWEPKQEQAA